jgi:hypothetical protein
MSNTLIKPILGLDIEIPNSLYIVYQESTKRYGCYSYNGIHGLACFSTEDLANNFAGIINFTDLTIPNVSFDEARDIAKERPFPVVCLMFLDNMQNPIIHYIR